MEKPNVGKDVEYFANLMTDGDEASSKMHQALIMELFQILIIMQFKFIEKIITELNKNNDGQYKNLVKYAHGFPDFIVDLWVEKMNDSVKKEMDEFKKVTGESDINKMMGGMFGNMFNMDDHHEKYKIKINEIAAIYKKSLKAGRKSENGEEK